MKRWVLFIPIAMIFLGLILIVLNSCSTQPLPHRALSELSNWGQGHSPGADHCPPGTIQFDIEDLFLECFRGTSHD